MKFKRHSKILELIEKMPIETQEELCQKLKEAGFKITQATVSRDIKELRLIKVVDSDGFHRYSSNLTPDESKQSARFRNIFKESVVSIDYALNTVVIKTLPGVASAAAAAIDNMKNSQVVGSLAGDDTIFLVMRREEDALLFCTEVKKTIK